MNENLIYRSFKVIVFVVIKWNGLDSESLIRSLILRSRDETISIIDILDDIFFKLPIISSI